MSLLLFTTACGTQLSTTSTAVGDADSTQLTTDDMPPIIQPELPIAERVDDLLARMTLAEKIGQMTLIEKDSIGPQGVTANFLGGVLSGGPYFAW